MSILTNQELNYESFVLGNPYNYILFFADIYNRVLYDQDLGSINGWWDFNNGTQKTLISKTASSGCFIKYRHGVYAYLFANVAANDVRIDKIDVTTETVTTVGTITTELIAEYGIFTWQNGYIALLGYTPGSVATSGTIGRLYNTSLTEIATITLNQNEYDDTNAHTGNGYTTTYQAATSYSHSYDSIRFDGTDYWALKTYYDSGTPNTYHCNLYRLSATDLSIIEYWSTNISENVDAHVLERPIWAIEPAGGYLVCATFYEDAAGDLVLGYFLLDLASPGNVSVIDLTTETVGGAGYRHNIGIENMAVSTLGTIGFNDMGRFVEIDAVSGTILQHLYLGDCALAGISPLIWHGNKFIAGTPYETGVGGVSGNGTIAAIPSSYHPIA